MNATDRYWDKTQLFVAYRELKISKMIKTQYHFRPKISHTHCVMICRYTQRRTCQSITSDNLHSASCKQSNSPCKDPNAHSLDPEHLEHAQTNRSSCFWVRAKTILSQLANGYVTPLSAQMHPNYYLNVLTLPNGPQQLV